MPGEIIFKLLLIGLLIGIYLLLKTFGVSEKKGKNIPNITEAYRVLQAYGLDSKISLEQFQNLFKQNNRKLDVYDIKYVIHDILHKHRYGFKIDWKWKPEDILSNIKTTIDPRLTYSLESKIIDRYTKEDVTTKDIRSYSISNSAWAIEGLVNNNKINITVSFNQPIEFINYLNPLLENQIKGRFVEHVSDGDEYAFVFIPKDKYQELSRSKYLV